jgi:fructokinase
MAEAPGLTVLDPNPRPRLIRDVPAFRRGVEEVAGSVALVKMSSEDASILYPGGEAEAIASMFARGVKAIVFTRGEHGASVFGRDGLRADVGIASGDGPVIDTMGAGDATLASIVSTIAFDGFPQDASDWRMLLQRAMRVAAATCRSHGGEIVVPDKGAAA